MTASKIHYMTVVQVQKIVDMQYAPYHKSPLGHFVLGAAISHKPDGGGIFPAAITIGDTLTAHCKILYTVKGKKLALAWNDSGYVPFGEGCELLVDALAEAAQTFKLALAGEEEEEEKEPEPVLAVKDMVRERFYDNQGAYSHTRYGRVIRINSDPIPKEDTVTILWLRETAFSRKLAKVTLKEMAKLNLEEHKVSVPADFRIYTYPKTYLSPDDSRSGYWIANEDFNF